MSRKYYEAYDDRYRQVHGENLRWFTEEPSRIVADTIAEFGISCEHRLLEIGCGEGRDARILLEEGYDLLATDISEAAVSHCKEKMTRFENSFRTLNCITERMEEKFDFIYAVAVIHMLVLEEDRVGFYRFIREQLSEEGIALICTMGDGVQEQVSDISTAFDLQERIHEETGRIVQIAGTSYRSVSFETFEREIRGSGLVLLKRGLTDVEPDYGKMMYAVVKKG